MQTSIPYQIRTVDAAPGSDLDLLALNIALSGDSVTLFEDTAPAIQAENLSTLHIELSLEAEVTGTSPTLSVTFGPVEFVFDMSGLARLAATYYLRPDPALHLVAGGGIVASPTTWAFVEPVAAGSFPTEGPVVLAPRLTFTHIELNLLRIQVRQATA